MRGGLHAARWRDRPGNAPGRFTETLAWVMVRSGKVYGEWDEGGPTRHVCASEVPGGIPSKSGNGLLRAVGHAIFGGENAAMNGLAPARAAWEVLWPLGPGGSRAWASEGCRGIARGV